MSSNLSTNATGGFVIVTLISLRYAVFILINCRAFLNFSVICPPLYLSISLSLRIVLVRPVDRAMHYSSVSFMSLQSWALTKGEQSRNTINQAHSPQWDTLIGCHRISMWIEKCCRPVCVHRDWLDPSAAPRAAKYQNQLSQEWRSEIQAWIWLTRYCRCTGTHLPTGNSPY